jgi:uncharacterized protein (TIRG00374 family)
MKNPRIIIQVIIGIAIIAFILKKLNIDEVVSVLKETNLLFFILACLAYLGLNFVLSFRLFYLLKKIGYVLKYPVVFLSHMGGMVVGDITPGRSGYFLTPSILKKNAGVLVTHGIACIFAPQGLEFILKVGGAVAAIFYISGISQLNSALLISISFGSLLVLAVGVSMLIISWYDEKLTLKLMRKLPFFNKFTENLSSFKEHNIRIKGSIKTILILYMIGWGFAALQWFYLGKAIGIELPFFTFFLLHPLITVLMFVPVSPAGLGLMEGGLIFVFSLLGIPSAQGLAFSVLVRVSILLVDLLGLKSVLTVSE